MEYLYYQQKMEPIKIKKRARTIPFGFKQADNPEYLEPIKEELDALKPVSYTHLRAHET